MVILDQKIPFVRAALNGSLAKAVEILGAAEQRHGLRWSNSKELLEECDHDGWYTEHLWPFLSETHMVMSGGDRQLTGCCLLGTDGLDHSPSWRHWGHVVSEWANVRWASRPVGLGRTTWTRKARPWEYLDFYSRDDLSYLVADYDQWIEALGKILELKNANT